MSLGRPSVTTHYTTHRRAPVNANSSTTAIATSTAPISVKLREKNHVKQLKERDLPDRFPLESNAWLSGLCQVRCACCLGAR